MVVEAEAAQQTFGIGIGERRARHRRRLPFRKEREDHLDPAAFEQVESGGDGWGFGDATGQLRIARAAASGRAWPRR